MNELQDVLAGPIVGGLRDNFLALLNSALSGKTPELEGILKKLDQADIDNLRSLITRKLDFSIDQMVNQLDDGPNTSNGLAITYGGKQITTGGYELGARLPFWLQNVSHFDADGVQTR